LSTSTIWTLAKYSSTEMFSWITSLALVGEKEQVLIYLIISGGIVTIS